MKKILFLLCMIIPFSAYSQDSVYVRQIVNKLTSKKFWGRGYTKNGMAKTANFLAKEYQSIGLKTLTLNFKQEFSYPVNTFDGRMEVSLNGIKLIAGKDFMISNDSKGLTKKALLHKIDSTTFQAGENLKVLLKDKLTWSVATEVLNNTTIIIKKSGLKEEPKEISVNIENKFVADFKTSNLYGFVKGTTYPDSILLITAHYDHLGSMGKNTYFPGANDNAAGVATLLSLAKYYEANPQKYTLGFICFAGEEAGLLGSKYFTEHPLFPLSKVKFLINLDLVGTGETGMTAVNASVYSKAFAILNDVNDEYKYMPKINSRGKAANSDHYFFTEKGVPSFFFYTQGGINAYHDIYDRPETLPLTKYNNLFNLIVKFNQRLMKK